MEAFRKIHPLEFNRKFLAQSIRPDGRPLTKVRKTVISAGSIGTAEGSGLVKIGNTSVLCGIKSEVGIPREETPDQGRLVISVELPPLCSPNFQTWKAAEDVNLALTSFISNILSSTGMLDLKELCIESGRAIWVLYVDIVCLNHDGNVLDAALLATVVALRNLRLPQVEITDTEMVMVKEQEVKKMLSIQNYPVPLSFGLIDDYVLADPTFEEESLLSTIFTIVYNNEGRLCSVYKPGGTVVSEAILRECMQQARTRTAEVLTLMNQPTMPLQQ